MEIPQRITITPTLPRQMVETGEPIPLYDCSVEPEYTVSNPDWFREGDEPDVQIVSLAISYDGGTAYEISTRFVPGTVLRQWEREIADKLVREAA